MNRVVVPARQVTQPGGTGSLESNFGLLKSLKGSAFTRWRGGEGVDFFWRENFCLLAKVKKASGYLT
jgi:hypothetical protein